MLLNFINENLKLFSVNRISDTSSLSKLGHHS